jgi:ribosome-associated protein
MLHITNAIELDESEIHFKFIRSPGPGGQHVNKAATAVQLRFDVEHASLPENVRLRLRQLAKNRINARGILIINANRFRSQDLNRKDAIKRLAELVAKSAQRIKPRHRTKPSIGSIKKRKEAKQLRSKLKRTRQSITLNNE